MKIIVLLSVLILQCLSEKVSDRIEKLPDFPSELLKQNWYSGYYNVTKNKHLHYLFVRSQHLPATDPLIIYFSGGPGFYTIPLAFLGLSPLKASFTPDL